MDAGPEVTGCGDTTVVPSCVGLMDRALAIERSGRRVVHMEKGELDFDTPEVVRRTAVKALEDGLTRYEESLGLGELREAICSYYEHVYGVMIAPERVLVTSGSSPALLAVLLALVGPGDEVLLTDPAYPAYRTLVELAGGCAVPVPTVADGFRPVAASLLRHVTPATTAVVVNSPGNPTGTVAADSELAAFARCGLTVVADEVYEPLVFDPSLRRSLLQYTSSAVVVNSFSKSFAMTGWRLGYAIVPDWLLEDMTRIVQDGYVAANTFVQRAAVSALHHATEIQEEWRAVLARRRDVLVEGLSAVGFDIAAEPQGAFYVLARLPEPHSDAVTFARRLLDEAAVAITPGDVFGPSAAGLVRFSYSTGEQAIAEGLERLERFLTSYKAAQEVCHGT